MNESELESYKSYSEQTAQDLYQEMIKKAAQLSEEFGKEIGEKAEQEARKFYQQMLSEIQSYFEREFRRLEEVQRKIMEESPESHFMRTEGKLNKESPESHFMRTEGKLNKESPIKTFMRTEGMIKQVEDDPNIVYKGSGGGEYSTAEAAKRADDLKFFEYKDGGKIR